MNANTGQTFPSFEAATAAGVPEQDIVTGHPKAIQKLSQMVMQRKKRNAIRQKARNASAESRRRNR